MDSPWYAGESQAVDEPNANNMDDSLLCHEILDYDIPHFGAEYHHFPLLSELNGSKSVTLGRIARQPCGLSDLDNLELDTPPDFQLSVRNVQWLFRICSVIVVHYSFLS